MKRFRASLSSKFTDFSIHLVFFLCISQVSYGQTPLANGYGNDQGQFDTLENYIATTMNCMGFTAASVAIGEKNGSQAQVVYAAGFGHLDDNTQADQNSIFRLGSLTKNITFLAMERLIEQQFVIPGTNTPITLNTPVAALFKQLGVLPAGSMPVDSEFDDITIRHLMEHRSGLVNVNSKDAAGNPASSNNIATNMQVQQLYSNYTLPPNYPGVGVQRIYSNVGFVFLRYLVDLLTSDSQAYIRQNIFASLGSVNDFFLASRDQDRARDINGVLKEPLVYHGWNNLNDDIVRWALAYSSSAEAYIRFLQANNLGTSGAQPLVVNTGSFAGTLAVAGNITSSSGANTTYAVFFNGSRSDDQLRTLHQDIQNILNNNPLPQPYRCDNVHFKNTNSAAVKFARWARAGGVEPISGDFNADGRTDLALFRQEAGWGSVPVAQRQGNDDWQIFNVVNTSLATWVRQSGTRLLKGDFNGDGADDVVMMQTELNDEPLPIAISNPSGVWQVLTSNHPEIAALAAIDNVLPIVGEFNGDGRSDIAFLRRTSVSDGSDKTVPVALSNGDGSWNLVNEAADTNVEVQSFVDWAARDDVNPVIGDFNGDGLTDISLIRRSSGWGSIPTLYADGDGTWTRQNRSVASAFTNQASDSKVSELVGDFNGDGRSEIALLHQNDETADLVIASSTDPNQSWATRSIPLNNFGELAKVDAVEAHAADFNRDGLTDIALIRRSSEKSGWGGVIPVALAHSNNNSWVMINNVNSGGAGWLKTPDTRIFIGDSNGDGNRADITITRTAGNWESLPVVATIEPPQVIPNGDDPPIGTDTPCCQVPPAPIEYCTWRDIDTFLGDVWGPTSPNGVTCNYSSLDSLEYSNDSIYFCHSYLAPNGQAPSPLWVPCQ